MADNIVSGAPAHAPLMSEAGGEDLARRPSAWRNLLGYLLKRILMLAAVVVTAVYLTILIANLGGFVDTIVASNIEFGVGMMARQEPFASMPAEQRHEALEAAMESAKEAAGLNEPFLLRTVGWLDEGLFMDWGQPTRFRPYFLSRPLTTVRAIVADSLSRTLLVFGAANVLLFATSVLLALSLNRRRGGVLDRLFILLSPFSSAPAWVYGVLLTTFFLRVLGFSPGGVFEDWEGGLSLTQLRVVLRHLLLPFLSIFLAGLFQSVYAWRSTFQVYSHEEYVDMARARGLPPGRVDRDYILRPALPALLTRFALLLALLWQEVIALEYFFNVQGVGRLFYEALQAFDTPMIVAIVTVFAYLLAITVFILDICYIFVDPRVRVGGDKQRAGSARASRSQRSSTIWTRGPKRSWQPWQRLPRPRLPRVNVADSVAGLRRAAGRAWETVRALAGYPSAVLGLAIIAALLAISVYTIVTIPYKEAGALWRGEGNVWDRTPRLALPTWVNLFRSDNLPPTITVDPEKDDVAREVRELDNGWIQVTLPFTFDYDYGGYPQEILVDLVAPYEERGPHVTLTWVRPDGSEQELTSFKPTPEDTYMVRRDERLMRRLRSERPHEALFLGAEGDAPRPVAGTYTLRVDALLFEPDTNVDASLTLLGQVYGLAGTDAQRRDLMLALLWGTPVALGFGLIAALATSLGSMIIAAAGAWYGGAVDRAVQFLTEVNLILPFFPVSLMIFILYSRSILAVLAVTVALTLFGSAVKTYRALFLQVRSLPYIEAARAYGASDWRIILRYMTPRILTVLIPRVIILVPGYVFLEATLAFLGVSDPVLPTWGKLVVTAIDFGVNTGRSHLVLPPLGMLFLTGFAFAMVGLALERVLEPRMREI